MVRRVLSAAIGALLLAGTSIATAAPATALPYNVYFTSQKMCRTVEYEYASMGYKIYTPSCYPLYTRQGTYYVLSYYRPY